ncbi:immunoglobulin-like domain-containing protein [Paenibacillus sp. S-38]|uniref:immunoglobulin-like domain-containing protein n=1 Tax=Paenibacillus sp. S-38 TaxID=3416710 RepID=UPI003CF1905A
MYRIRFTKRFMNALLAATLVLSPIGGGTSTVLASTNPIGLKVTTDSPEYDRGYLVASISIRGDQLGLTSDADAEELHIRLTYDGDVFDTSNYTVPIDGGWQYTDSGYYSAGPNLSSYATVDAPIVVDNGDGTYTMDLNIKADDPDNPIQASSDEVVMDLIMDVKDDAPAAPTSIAFTSVTMKSANGSIITTNQDAGAFSLTDANVSVLLPDDEAVAEDLSELAIGYAANESDAGVQSNVTLPQAGDNGSTVTWSSSDPSVISEQGTVQRPAVGQGNATVDLTATITRGNVTDTRIFTLTVLEQALSDAQAVAEAKMALAVGYAPLEDQNTVKSALTLPTSGAQGTTVSWSSDTPAVVTNSGAVTRPAYSTGDVTATLTATLTRGNASDTQVFPVKVLRLEQTDEEAVEEAKEALSVGYLPGDTAGAVTQNVTLPLSGINGTAISWGTSDAGVITNTGVVSRPANGTGNQTVTLTATISRGAATRTQPFQLTVLEPAPNTLSDADAVALAKEALEVGYASGDSTAHVTQNVILPASGLHDTAISWTSTNANRVDASGAVTRGDTTETVQVTATISKGAATLEKTFDLTVPLSDAAAVAADKAALLVGLQPNDETDSVTGNVTLPAAGLNGTTITWSSDKTNVISDTGTVVRPSYSSGNAAVVLTATVQKGQALDTKPFPLTVLEAAQTSSEGSNGGSTSNEPDGGSSGGIDALSDADAVTLAKEALEVGYASGDSAAHVTQNVILPGNGLHGTVITWTSTNVNRVDASGAVTRGDTTETVQVTATISKGAATLEKTFDLTVPLSDAAAVAADKAALLVGLQSNDQPDSVTGNVTLPAAGLNGTTITWSSDKTNVISDTGTVIRPSYSSGNAAVILTATVQKGQALDTKAFTLTVLKAARKSSGGGGGGGTSTSTPTTPAPNTPVPDTKPAPPNPEHAGIFNSSVVKSDSSVKENVLAKVEEAKKTAAPAEVSDTKGHWAQKTLDLFVRLNVIQGYEDGTAKPDQAISRGEFVSILSRLFQVSGSQQVNLQDIGDHWAADAIQQFAAAGVIGGYGDGTFQPDRTISREEIVVIMSRLINMNQVDKNQAPGNFQDVGESYAKETIQDAAKAGIIQGKGPGRFEPNSSSTRAEALQIILNTLNLNPDIKSLLDSLQKKD